MSIRVRFAPSPTGPLHIGGVRTALYNYLLAKKLGGSFIVRIEDTDQTRWVEGAEKYIFETLDWLGLQPDESPVHGGKYSPYRQSERKALYKDFAMQLIDSGHAYYAFDTPEELDKMRDDLKAQGVPNPQYNSVTRQYMKNALSLSEDEVQQRIFRQDPFVIRLKMPRNEEIKFKDTIRGFVSFHSNQLDDKVLFKSDGMPTYHLANVVDDYLMKITHVIRGEEWLPSAPTHVYLYRAFGWEEVMPDFAHLPLILKPDGNGKLSKRDGDRLGFPVFPLNWDDPQTHEKSEGFKSRGFFADALVNFLAFLGWNPGTQQEIFSREELIQNFSLERVGKSGAKFDFEKLKWFNQQYFKIIPLPEIVLRIEAEAKALQYPPVTNEFLTIFAQQMLDRVSFFNDFLTVGRFYFYPPKQFDIPTLKKKWKDNSKQNLTYLIERFNRNSTFNHDSIAQNVNTLIEEYQLSMGEIGPLLRIAVCGTMQGPPIFEVMALIGKNEVIERLNYAVQNFENMIP